MKFEISIEGPLEALKILCSQIKSMDPSMREIHTGYGEEPPDGRIIVLEEDDPGLDSSLQDISESINRVERALAHNSLFDLRVRNLSYSEPPSGCSTFMESFRPIPSLTVQPWTPSMNNHKAEPGTIVLDPHHAFGTGKHPTTRLCLRIMEKILKEKQHRTSVLDFGCGTGLLAISAKLIGAGKCLGVEIDAQAAKTAQRNVMLNGLEDKIDIRQGSWEIVHERFDLVFANIVTAALMRCGPQIPEHLNEDGISVVSGFGVKQVKEMDRLFGKAGLQKTEVYDLDGWAALVLKRIRETGNPGSSE
ncbi:50S ribosomal protein L11 methyltransferase [Thermodesulfobacteriota bacterium]